MFPQGEGKACCGLFRMQAKEAETGLARKVAGHGTQGGEIKDTEHRIEKQNIMEKTKWFARLCMLLCMTCGLAACGDDEDKDGVDGEPSELLIGTWEAYDAGGYKIIGGVKDEYNEDNIFGYYEFRTDGTGDMWDDGDSEKDTFTWSVEKNVLRVAAEEHLSGDETHTEEYVYAIETLNKTDLRIGETTVDEDGDTFYEWTKLRKVK